MYVYGIEQGCIRLVLITPVQFSVVLCSAVLSSL